MQSSLSPLFHPFRKPCLNPLSSFAYELSLISRDYRSKRIFGLIAFNIFCIILVSLWCISTNSLSLAIYSILIWIDFLSLLTCLLGFWVELKKPNKLFTYGHIRCEILAVFVVVIVTQISCLLIVKESFMRLSQQPEVHTSRLLLGTVLCLFCHSFITYINDKGRAFNHVLTFSCSNIFQEQLSKFSHSLCQLIPGLSAILLPRVNPLMLFGSIGFFILIIVHIIIEFHNYLSFDTISSLLLGIIFIITMFPMGAYTATILLQTAPAHMIAHLDKCLREASTMDGVLEFRNEHFWILGFGDIVGTLHVRIRRDANEQVVLSHLSNRLSNLVSELTIQVFKDEWAWNPTPRLTHKDHSVLMKYTHSTPSSIISKDMGSAHQIVSPSTTIVINSNSEKRNDLNSHDNWVQIQNV